jgi:hypothetical protein
MREWLPIYAEAIGAKRPPRIPVWLARIAAGPTASLVSRQPGAANDKAKGELGWKPSWPSWLRLPAEANGVIDDDAGGVVRSVVEHVFADDAGSATAATK